MRVQRNSPGLRLVASLLVLISFSSALADSPTAEIKATVDRGIKILTDPNLRAEAHRNERRKLLREVISARFDFREMARRSLGPAWRNLTPEKQGEFVRLFTDLLEKAYVGRMESYNGEKITYTGERIDGPYAEVDSRIVTSKGEEFTLNYLAHSVNHEWKVYDVVVGGVSLVNNYRSQFDRVIYESSYDELIRRMRQKISEDANHRYAKGP